MEEQKKLYKKLLTKKPYKVDVKVLESKGFKLSRYDRHESYLKTYLLDNRVFIGAVNPVTGDRTISKAGPFASIKDIEVLRAAWDRLSEDILGPRPAASNPQDAAVMENYATEPAVLTAPAPGNGSLTISNGVTYNVHDLTGDKDAVTCPHCGKSHFSVDSTSAHAIAMPQIVRDGKIVEQPPLSKTTWHCTCLECGNTFDTQKDPFPQTDADAQPIPTSGAAETAKNGR